MNSMRNFIKKILKLDDKLIIRYFDDNQLLKGEMIYEDSKEELFELMKDFNKKMVEANKITRTKIKLLKG